MDHDLTTIIYIIGIIMSCWQFPWHHKGHPYDLEPCAPEAQSTHEFHKVCGVSLKDQAGHVHPELVHTVQLLVTKATKIVYIIDKGYNGRINYVIIDTIAK